MDRVTYLGHSGFVVELPNVVMVFDCTIDPSHSVKKILAKNEDKPVVFFVSHYYKPESNHTSIYEVGQNHRRYYVISNDVLAQNIPTNLDVQGMSAGDYFEGQIPGIKSVKAFATTGKGICYYVDTTDGVTYFHAGNLNDWHDGHLNKREQASEESKFHKIVNQIAGYRNTVDVAFFPVDLRQGNDFGRGAREFMEVEKVKDFFPMHFDGNAKQACNSESYLSAGTTCHCLYEPGESIELSKAATMA